MKWTGLNNAGKEYTKAMANLGADAPKQELKIEEIKVEVKKEEKKEEK